MSESSIPVGYCHCGCGAKTTVLKQSIRKKGLLKGEYRKYVHGHNPAKPFSKNPLLIRTEKKCTGCNKVFPATTDYFGKHSPSRDGLTSKCKPCKREASRAYNAAYVERHPERIKASRERYLEMHPERNRESKQRYDEANRAAINLYKAGYYAANRERYGVYRDNRRALLANAEGTYTPAEIRQMYEDQDGLCAYCEKDLEGRWHKDHMIPLSRGGRNDWTNLALVCERCNIRKHAHTVEKFFGLMGWAVPLPL